MIDPTKIRALLDAATKECDGSPFVETCDHCVAKEQMPAVIAELVERVETYERHGVGTASYTATSMVAEIALSRLEIDKLRTELAEVRGELATRVGMILKACEKTNDLTAECAALQRILDQCTKIVADVVPSTECLTVDLTTLATERDALAEKCKEWEVSASMACESPCGDCHGCHIANQILDGPATKGGE